VLALVTLASPHQRLPAHFQPALARFYRRLSATAGPPVPVVSIAGGTADVQVQTGLQHLSPACRCAQTCECSTGAGVDCRCQGS
jgi:PGAP1-like protein